MVSGVPESRFCRNACMTLVRDVPSALECAGGLGPTVSSYGFHHELGLISEPILNGSYNTIATLTDGRAIVFCDNYYGLRKRFLLYPTLHSIGSTRIANGRELGYLMSTITVFPSGQADSHVQQPSGCFWSIEKVQGRHR